MALLKNQKHERFAQLLATGMSATEAYTKVYKKKGAVAGSAGGRLLKKVQIQQRLAELQQKAADSSVMTLQEKLEFLAMVKRTPIGEIDENSPLCQAWEYSVTGGNRGTLRRGHADRGNEQEEEERTVIKVKMPCKLKAVELSAKLQGEFKEKVEVSVDGLGELLKMIRGGK